MRYHLGVIALALCVARATAIPLQQPALSTAVNDDPPIPAPAQPPQPTEPPQPPQPTEPPQPPQPTETTQPSEPSQPPQTTEVPMTTPVSVCTLGEKKGNPENCRKYSECKDNAWVEQSCYWFWKFDSVSKKCKFWGATCTAKLARHLKLRQ